MSVRLHVLARKLKCQFLSAGKRIVTNALLERVIGYVMKRNLGMLHRGKTLP